MTPLTIKFDINGSVAWVWMDRSAVHNALSESMIDELTDAFRSLNENSSVRIIVLSGRGKSFSAGADVESMKRQGGAPFEANLADARRLAEMFRVIASSPKPTIARVNGAAIGGGFGLVSACDIAIASTTAFFAMSEVRLGLIPATIAPYVIRSIGPRCARRLFQTGERITAAQAEKIGLISEIAEPDQLDSVVQSVIDNLLKGAPHAQRAAKDLIDSVAAVPITNDLIENAAKGIARIRSEGEAREGLAAFLEKRPPPWARER
jgi:methylglutaconyl-CoA hydratase